MAKRIHQVVQHRRSLAGVDALSILSEHSFPRHAHDQFGIGVMTEGAQRSWSVIGDVESMVGNVLMVNPGEMHDGHPMGGARGWHIAYLDPGLVIRETDDDPATRHLVVRPMAHDPPLAHAVLRLFAALAMHPGADMAAEELLLRCLARVVQRHGVDGPQQTRPPPSVGRALQRLHDAPERPTSIAELAALSGVSRFQLLRGFFRQTGATPHAYLVQLRVRLARRLLAEGTPPADVALLAGFADQSHLTRAFVRQFGITPGRYRSAVA